MEVKTYYKNQLQVAIGLANIIDSYLKNEIEENIMIKKVNKIVINNREKVINKSGYTAIVRQKCGKRRLDIISKILKENLIRGD